MRKVKIEVSILDFGYRWPKKGVIGFVTTIHGSISPTFYERLLRSQIPKAEKMTDYLTLFFARLGSVHVKASRKMLVKLTPVTMVERAT